MVVVSLAKGFHKLLIRNREDQNSPKNNDGMPNYQEILKQFRESILYNFKWQNIKLSRLIALKLFMMQ